MNFQTKCFEKLREIKKMGATIVIVSHSLPQIEQICERTLWIDKGLVVDNGIPKYVHEHYLEVMEGIRLEKKEEQEEHPQKEVKVTEKENKEPLPVFCSDLSIRIGNRDIEFVDVRLTDIQGNDKKIFSSGEPFVVWMDYVGHVAGLEGNFGIGIFRDDGVHVYGTNILIEHDVMVKICKQGTVKIFVEGNCLLPARYMLDVAIHSQDGIRFDDIRNVTPFEITASKKDIGVCRLNNFWEVDGKKLEKRIYV